MNLSEKAMNASEKRILKLAIILVIIGLTVRYLPWGLPSIETFEVGDAIIVANASLGAFSDAPGEEKGLVPAEYQYGECRRFVRHKGGGAKAC